LGKESFEQVYKKDSEDMEMGVVYDVAHNIAKKEKHNIKGIEQKFMFTEKVQLELSVLEEKKFLRNTGKLVSQL